MISLQKLKKMKKGTITPLIREVDSDENALALFAKLSDYGRKENSILLESADLVKKYGEKSIGSVDPCLKVLGRGNDFEINALNSLGERFLEVLHPALGFVDEIEFGKAKVSGSLKRPEGNVSESERLELKTHADVLRAIAFAFKPDKYYAFPFSGLFGAISYDFIDQFESLPSNKLDSLGDPDYEMLFLDNLFLFNSVSKKYSFIANALLTGESCYTVYEQCLKKIEVFENALEMDSHPSKSTVAEVRVEADVSDSEYIKMVEKMKQHINAGDVFQIVPSRTFSCAFKAEPLDIYTKLRELNPSPYMFFFRDRGGVLLGSSPETFLKVEGEIEKTVEIRPIAGTRKRGIVDGEIDEELDSEMERELKSDEKELAEHTMLVDLARNDVARVSIPGTRVVDKLHFVEKYSHVMHLVSNVRGVLRPELDALHAYLTSMNMGTLTGAPKIKAMELLRLNEKEKRGFYGGSVGYLTPCNDFDSCIVIRGMRLKDGKAHIRAGAGIVFDSVPIKEAEETMAKAGACIDAIKAAQGALK